MARRDRTGQLIVIWTFRILVGTLFLVSGLIKVNDISGFGFKLEEYFEVFRDRFGFPADPFVAAQVGLAAVISIFEVVVAIFLLFGVFRKFTTLSLLAMIVFFTFLTGYSAITNSVNDCGCFGDALKLTPYQSFFKDLILLALICPLYFYQEYITPLIPNPKFSLGAVGALSALTGFLTFFCYTYEPIVDFRAACECCDMKRHTEALTPDGMTVLPDYIPTQDFCEKDIFQGKTLLIVFKNMEKLPTDRIATAMQLGAELHGTDVMVMGLSSSPSDVVKQMKEQYKPSFCIAPQDPKFLKTIIRSKPGFMLLHNGVVVKKWAFASLPSKNDILSAQSCAAVVKKGELPK